MPDIKRRHRASACRGAQPTALVRTIQQLQDDAG
jgi:hypothetical protein